MNQTNAKTLTLSADEVRNLHTEIFALLAKIADLSVVAVSDSSPADVDGGKF